MAGPLQHPAVAGADREDVARGGNIVGRGLRVDGGFDRMGPVMGGNAGGNPFTRLDRHGEAGLEFRGIARDHLGQREAVDNRPFQRKADQPAAIQGHEIDDFRRHRRRRDNEIAFIFAVFVIDQDKHAAGAGLFDDLIDRSHAVARLVKADDVPVRNHAVSCSFPRIRAT